jgi:hypothetical protein
MAWNHDEQRAKRDYRNPEEAKNYTAGYSDGFHGYPMWSGSDRNYYPNAYSAGYWEGKGDNEKG